VKSAPPTSGSRGRPFAPRLRDCHAARLDHRAQDRIEHLKRAVDSHGLIGQAMGILMCRYGITADTAFATLGRVSQAHNLKLRALSDP
jgi:AmiR/NasT family two-component response regulator